MPVIMGYKSRKIKEASRPGYEASRNDSRTRDGEKENSEHLHAELSVARKCIAELREDLDKKATEIKEAKLEVSNLKAKFATIADSFEGPNCILRQKI